jgi:hypothetical protein
LLTTHFVYANFHRTVGPRIELPMLMAKQVKPAVDNQKVQCVNCGAQLDLDQPLYCDLQIPDEMEDSIRFGFLDADWQKGSPFAVNSRIDPEDECSSELIEGPAYIFTLAWIGNTVYFVGLTYLLVWYLSGKRPDELLYKKK